MKRGDIYYIHKDYAPYGSEQQPGRPAIIVSNNKCNASSSVVEIVFLTTKQKKPLPTHVEIRANYISTALCEQVHSVDIDRVGTYMCSCTKEEMDQVDKALKISLGLIGENEKGEEVAMATCQASSVDTLEYAKLIAERDVYKQLYNDLVLKMIS